MKGVGTKSRNTLIHRSWRLLESLARDTQCARRLGLWLVRP